MIVLFTLLVLIAVIYVGFGVSMIQNYHHTWKDKLIGYGAGALSISLGLYLLLGLAIQLRYYING